MDVRQKNILVVGLGRSGAAAAAFLKNRGAAVTVTDAAPAATLGPAVGRMQDMGIGLELGGHRSDSFRNADLIVLSPGVPHTIAPIRHASDRGVPIIGEIELAAWFIDRPVVAVTGTNGKTTVTALVGKMLRQSGVQTFVGGNIGTPLIDCIGSDRPAEVIVAEVSSFQLDTIATFRPDIGVLLNITPDHLDRYDDFDAYARSKARLFENQTDADTAIVNGSDPVVHAVSRDIAAQTLSYPLEPAAGCDGAFLDGARIRCRRARRGTIDFDLSRIRFAGRHNLENACAACLAALAAGGTAKGIQSALDAFVLPEHRLTHVATIAGVAYYNDSKATNVHAVARAIDSFDRPVVLIMGGRDKGSDFRALRTGVRRQVKHLIVMGEARATIAEALDGTVPIDTVTDMTQAVAAASRIARSGEIVLLSPGCASFDSYTDYGHRGAMFQQYVMDLM